MSELHDSSLPTPTLASAEGESAAVRFARMMHQLQSSVDELRALIGSERLAATLVAQLSCDPSFIRLVRTLAQEVLAERIASEHQEAHTELFPMTDVLGYQVRLSEDPTPFRGSLTDADHPAYPNDVELLVENPQTQEWQLAHADALLKEDIRRALNEAQVKPYQFRYLDITVLSSKPLNEASRRLDSEPSHEQQ